MDSLIMLLEEMDKILQEISPMKVKIKQKDLIKFHEITGVPEAQINQSSESIVTPTYFLTLLAPLGTKLMLKILEHQNLPKIRGFIHSKSEVNFFKPIQYGAYEVWSRVETLQKKQGKMGNYIVLTFRMSLMNEKEEEVGNDIHQFFLRLPEEAD